MRIDRELQVSWKATAVRALVIAAIAISVTGLLVPSPAEATEEYRGNVTGECSTHNGINYNVKASAAAPNWLVGNLEYRFNPVPSQGSDVIDTGQNLRFFSVPPGEYTVEVGTPGFTASSGYQATYTIKAPNCRQGMTWRFIKSNPSTGTIRVGCAMECDARKGTPLAPRPYRYCASGKLVRDFRFHYQRM